MTLLNHTPNTKTTENDNNNVNITPPFIYTRAITETKSRQSLTNEFNENKKFKIRVGKISGSRMNLNAKEYMPYYKSLKLSDEFWISKYEPIRVTQSELYQN